MTTDSIIDPTPERIAKAGHRFEAREISRDRQARYNRITSWWESMTVANGGRSPILDAHQALAARQIDIFWHMVYDEKGVTSSYGSPKWNGTPVGQLDMTALNGPERREVCRVKLGKAKRALDDVDGRLWPALVAVIEVDGQAVHAGHALGRQQAGQASAAGVLAIQIATRVLARHFGFETSRNAKDTHA